MYCANPLFKIPSEILSVTYLDLWYLHVTFETFSYRYSYWTFSNSPYHFIRTPCLKSSLFLKYNLEMGIFIDYLQFIQSPNLRPVPVQNPELHYYQSCAQLLDRESWSLQIMCHVVKDRFLFLLTTITDHVVLYCVLLTTMSN